MSKDGCERRGFSLTDYYGIAESVREIGGDQKTIDTLLESGFPEDKKENLD